MVAGYNFGLKLIYSYPHVLTIASEAVRDVECVACSYLIWLQSHYYQCAHYVYVGT